MLISVYNESIIRDRDGAEMLRPEPFVAVCEHMSIHDDILSVPTLILDTVVNKAPTSAG